VGAKIPIPEDAVEHKASFPYTCLLKVWRIFEDVVGRVYVLERNIEKRTDV
jgi:hypothetical protein